MLQGEKETGEPEISVDSMVQNRCFGSSREEPIIAEISEKNLEGEMHSLIKTERYKYFILDPGVSSYKLMQKHRIRNSDSFEY